MHVSPVQAPSNTATLEYTDTDIALQNGKKAIVNFIHLCCNCIFLKGIWMRKLNSDADLANVSGSTQRTLALNLLTAMCRKTYGNCT